jgi:hypothetical protein
VSLPSKKIPGTSYSVQLQANPNKTGKLSLIKGKWPVIEKVLPSLDAKTVNSMLEDIILSEGFELNPRILLRIVGELMEEMNAGSATSPVIERSSELIEIEEHTPPTETVQPLIEESISPSANEAITSPPVTPTTSEATLEHIQVLKMQIKELHNLVKDIYKKFDALSIIAEKLEE